MASSGESAPSNPAAPHQFDVDDHDDGRLPSTPQIQVFSIVGMCVLVFAAVAIVHSSMQSSSPRVLGPKDGYVSIGLVTDTHYAQKCRPGVPQCDRTLDYMEVALEKLKALGATWAVHNGDSKDENDDVKTNQEESRLLAIGYAREIGAKLTQIFPVDRVIRVVGNHDTDRLTKGEFLEAVGERAGHFTRQLSKHVTAIVLDAAFDEAGRNFSKVSCDEPGTNCKGQAVGKWSEPNIPAEQLEWLSKELRELEKERKRAIVFCHFRLDGDKEDALETGWTQMRFVMNAKATRTVLEDYRSAVLAVFHGHDHRAENSPRLIRGIGYYTLPGIVEAEQARDTPHALIEVWPLTCRVKVTGYGQVNVADCKPGQSCRNRKIPALSVDWTKDDCLPR